MFAAVIGKHYKRLEELNKLERKSGEFKAHPYELLIANPTTLALRLRQLVLMKQDFVLNAIVSKDKEHFHNVLFFNSIDTKNNDCIKAISMEPNNPLECFPYEMVDVGAEYGLKIHIIVPDVNIHNATNGCHHFALYLSEKMSQITDRQSAEQLFCDIKAKPEDKIFSYTRLPLRFGAMNVCQSMTVIQHVISNLKDPQSLTKAVNHKNETQEVVLRRNTVTIQQDDGTEKQRNHALWNKAITKHKQRAFDFTAMNKSVQIEQLATFSGIKFLYPEYWKELTELWLLEAAQDLQSFHEFDLEWEYLFVSLESANEAKVRSLIAAASPHIMSILTRIDCLEALLDIQDGSMIEPLRSELVKKAPMMMGRINDIQARKAMMAPCPSTKRESDSGQNQDEPKRIKINICFK